MSYRSSNNAATQKKEILIMSGKNTAVFGIYSQYANLESGVDALKSAGFRSTDISVLFPENLGTKDFAHEKGTKLPEGATAGAGTGAVIGGGLGWLAGIGALAIPGLGPFIAAGPAVAAVAGVGAGGAVGGFTGALIGLGIPQYEAPGPNSVSASCGRGRLAAGLGHTVSHTPFPLTPAASPHS